MRLSGWFNAYGFAAQNTTADVFIHLGDYVREIPSPFRQIREQTSDLRVAWQRVIIYLTAIQRNAHIADS